MINVEGLLVKVNINIKACKLDHSISKVPLKTLTIRSKASHNASRRIMQSQLLVNMKHTFPLPNLPIVLVIKHKRRVLIQHYPRIIPRWPSRRPTSSRELCKAGSMVGSRFPKLESLFFTKLQWMEPTVCAPRTVTISFKVKPFALNGSNAWETENDDFGKFTSLGFETNPSCRLVGTWYVGPPTRETASLVASIRMSAHETVERHAFSKALFISSINSKLFRFMLGGACSLLRYVSLPWIN